MIPTDPELVQQALSGSQPAYKALVTRYARPAVNLAARMVQDRALAEDLAQEAFIRAFERLSSYDSSRRFASWFFRILHNVTIDYLRHKRPKTFSLESVQEGNSRTALATAPEKTPETLVEESDASRALDAALACIRPEYREAVILHYREEQSLGEVAAAMGVPQGTVKTYLYRARKELAAILAAKGWVSRGKAEPETADRKISYEK